MASKTLKDVRFHEKVFIFKEPEIETEFSNENI